MRNLFSHILFVVLVLAALPAVGQQVPQAGVSIDNQASGYHFFPSYSDTVFKYSNTVSLIVQEAENINLVPNHREKIRIGQVTRFTHTLSNTGNIPTTVTITAENTMGDDFDLDNIILSTVDGASEMESNIETAVAWQAASNEITVDLEPGEVFDFTVSLVVPNAAKARDLGQVKIEAKTSSGKLILSNTDILEVLEGPRVEVVKKAAESTGKQGGEITYLITGSNEGDQTARTFNIQVNDVPLQKVILRDPIPANTSFLRTLSTEGGMTLYHTVDDPEFTYSTTLPDDLSRVDEFAVAYDSIAPGQEFEAQFVVVINENAAGLIKNIAQVDYRDPIDDEQQSTTAETNLVEEVLPEYEAELDYYTDDNYKAVSRAARISGPLYLQANAAACNASSAVKDTTIITFKSRDTGDIEELTGIETGHNTGYFRVRPNAPLRDAAKYTVIKRNNIIETEGGDIITAILPACGENQEAVSTQIHISPYGVIFNSEDGKPVANTSITLIDVTGEGNGGNPGAPATVYNEQGTEEIENTQKTGEDGEFEFPYVQPSTYRIEVEPPTGWRFASIVKPQDLPDNRKVDERASYGLEFEVTGEPGPVGVDVPVDPATDGILFIEKTASTSGAEIGDFITYQITVANNASTVVSDVRVEDILPFGFRYEKGTARRDEKPIADPDGGKGPSLSFMLGDLQGNSSVTLTYRVLLGTGALNGDGTNRAVAVSNDGLQITSNEAQSKVEVRGGVFTDKGYIIGKVFADVNENDVQDPGEPGVPGVRLYLENGSFVITDSEGKYTFYGINPNKHTIKVDNYSLPQGSRLGVLDNRHAGDPSTRFVDLKNGELHRADFAICDLTEAAKREIEDRRKQFNMRASDEVETTLERNFSTDAQDPTHAVRRAQASGVVDGVKLPGFRKQKNGGSAVAQSSSAIANDTAAVEQITLEDAMLGEKAEIGFIGLQDNDTLQVAQTRIWIKGRSSTALSLSVNGEEIGEDRISKRSKLPAQKLQAQEYIGVNLTPGENTLTLTATDPFGNERGRKQITVFAPGHIHKIKLTTPVNDVPADGVSTAVVKVWLQDKEGVTVNAKTPVTLDVSIGEWLVKDLDSSTPGTQTYVTGGEAEFELQSTIQPQDADVRVSIGVMEAETVVSFLPDLRPLIAAGIIEGTIRLNEGASIVPARSADGFERELKSLSYSTDDYTADARAAFFLKGKIKGNMLLTAGFDSEKDDDRLFRDIQPDEFYPVYGESSVKGYDAQSTGRLYVRVDHKKTYALYGDFVTQERHLAKSLGEYNRTQTGIKLHYEKDWARINVFGSQASSLQRIDEFRGQGISGPYELQFDNILINSEQVEIITRDRNQPSIILEREKLVRFRDYVVEPFTGNILFKTAVPSVDPKLNPVFIRVTYEVEGGAEDYLIGGADAQIKVTDFFEVGGSFVEDRNPEDNYRLKSINSTLRLGENTVLIGEAAESTTELEGTGRGGRIELQHRGSIVDGRVYAGQTDEDFVNRASQLGQGRTEAGALGSIKLTNSTNLKGEFLYSSNDTLGTNTTGGLLNIQQRITNDIRAEVGVRYSKQNRSQSGISGDEDITNKNIRGKLTVGVPKVKGATIYGEYEQDINESDRKLIAVGGDYQLKNRGRIYARHEFISSALGQYTLNSSTERQNTVVGIDANYMQNGQVYSEYRVDDAFDGRNAQAAIGLRNRFEIREGFGINAGLERIFSLTGDPLNEGTAISAGVDYTANPLWKGTARAEARFSNNGNSYLSTLGYGRKIDPNWTFLGKNIFSLQTSSNPGTADRIQQRLRFGFAYRETAQNRWDGLGRYELKYEKNGQFGGDYNRLVHIFSTHVNYHPSADWTHTGRFAAKKVAESSAEFDSKSLTMLLSARSIHDITRKLDGGINASMMTDAGFSSQNYGVGVELGYIVHRNLRLAIGFNVFGFEDRDLAASSFTRKGVYLGFSYKFDERLFRGLMPDEDKNDYLYATCDECAEPSTKAEALSLPGPELDFKGLQPVIIEAPDFKVANRKSLVTLPKNIHFGFDKNEISEASKRMLNLVAQFLKDQDAFKLEVTGHTDSQASYQYNLNLSKRRAVSVREYLISQGVDASKVTFKGWSFDDSKTDREEDAIDRSINRRVQLNMDIPNVNVRFIPQINDLQIEKQRLDGMQNTVYVLDTRIDAVPDRIHLNGTALRTSTKYMLSRIAMALKYHPEEKAIFSFAESQVEQQQIVADFLQQAGADMNRIILEVVPASTNGDTEAKAVTIDYGEHSQLISVEQTDDLRLADNAKIEMILDKMIELLKLREDHLLITKNRK